MTSHQLRKRPKVENTGEQSESSLEEENKRLQREIAALKEELAVLNKYEKEDEVPVWLLQMMNQSYKQQIFQYRTMRTEMMDFVLISNSTMRKSDVLHASRMNCFFLLEKVPEMMEKYQSIAKPLNLALQQPQLSKKTSLYREMLKICLREYALQADLTYLNLEFSDLLKWESSMFIDWSQTNVAITESNDNEKWITFTVNRFPVSQQTMRRIVEKLDIFTVMIMASSAMKAAVEENIGESSMSFSLGYSREGLVPLSILNQGNSGDGPFRWNYKRPSSVADQDDLAFISTSDFSDPKGFTLVQSLVPTIDADLEALESNGAFVARGVSVKEDSRLDATKSCNVSIFSGAKFKMPTKMNDKENLRLMEQFRRSLKLLGGEAFLKTGLHSPELMASVCEALLKTAVFVDHEAQKLKSY